MSDRILLQSLENDPTKKEDAYTALTSHSSLIPINRDGLYFSLFNKMYDENFQGISHVLCAQFKAFQDEKLFYRFENINSVKADYGVLLFYLNPEHCSLEVLEDALSSLKGSPIQWRGYYHYDVNLAEPSHQLYVTRFFQMLSEHFGHVPDPYSSLDIQKMASFENFAVAEMGVQWKCLDNCLLHVLLSKGAYLLQPEIPFKYVVKEEATLSPFHKIQIVEKLENYSAEEGFEDDLAQLNYFQKPQDMKIFYHLMYKNIFKGMK